jgi:sporulation and spore germination protein
MIAPAAFKGETMDGKIFRFALLSLLVMLLAAMPACKKKEEQPPAQQARVSATSAYEKYFGPAPTTDKGTCYAFVIYFPSAKEPGKVVPFPFFTFDEGSMKKVAVERLIGGMEVSAYRDEIRQPFAAGAHLLGLSQLDGVVRIDLSKDFLKGGKEGEGALNALALTITQFKGAKGVSLLSEGKELDFAKGTQLPLEGAILTPSSPRLLSVTAVKDKGAKEVEEVSAYFDRPVDIKELTMTDGSGKAFAGDIFHSVFDMAAVLKPKEPTLFKAGMPVKVRWKVVDKVGRAAEGEKEYSLEVKEH